MWRIDFLWPRPDANIHGVFTLPELFPKPSVDDTFWSEMEQLEVINICLGGVSYISLGWQHPSSKMAPTQFLCQNSAAVGQKVDEEKNWEKRNYENEDEEKMDKGQGILEVCNRRLEDDLWTIVSRFLSFLHSTFFDSLFSLALSNWGRSWSDCHWKNSSNNIKGKGSKKVEIFHDFCY